MALKEDNFPSPRSEAEYINGVMQEMYNKHKHLAMVFDYKHLETPALLTEMGYDIKVKTLEGKSQITVISKAKK